MNTKYDIGDKVLIECTIKEIKVDEISGIQYFVIYPDGFETGRFMPEERIYGPSETRDVDLPKRVPLITPEELKRQFGIVSPSEHAQKQYAVDPEELKRQLRLDGQDKIQGFVDGMSSLEDNKND